MADESGLMAPIGSKARAEYEKRRKYEDSWRAALAEMLTPLTYAPQPVVSVPATVGEALAREGPSGLMGLWESIVLPFMNRAKGVVSILGKAPKRAAPHEVQAILRQGSQSPLAREYYRDTGQFISPTGDTMIEIPDINARVTDKAREAVERVFQTAKPVKMPLSDFMEHDALFARYPELRKIPVKLVPGVETAYTPPTDPGKKAGGKITIGVHYPQSPLKSALHEAAHAVQYHDSLPSGSSPEHMLARLEALAATGQIPDALNTPGIARLLYLLKAGEIGARTAQERQHLTRAERLAEIPTTGGAKAFRSNFPLLSPHGGISDEAVVRSHDPDEIARVARLLLRVP